MSAERLAKSACFDHHHGRSSFDWCRRYGLLWVGACMVSDIVSLLNGARLWYTDTTRLSYILIIKIFKT